MWCCGHLFRNFVFVWFAANFISFLARYWFWRRRIFNSLMMAAASEDDLSKRSLLELLQSPAGLDRADADLDTDLTIRPGGLNKHAQVRPSSTKWFFDISCEESLPWTVAFFRHLLTKPGFFIQPLCGNAGNSCCRKTEFWGIFGTEFCNLVEFLLRE